MKNKKQRLWFKGMALLVSLAVLGLSFGCSQKMVITTSPQGATVIANEEPIGKSPLEYRAKKSSVTFMAKKEGYSDSMRLVKKEWDNNCVILCVVLGIFLFLPAFAFIPVCKEYPDNVYIELEKETTSMEPPG